MQNGTSDPKAFDVNMVDGLQEIFDDLFEATLIEDIATRAEDVISYFTTDVFNKLSLSFAEVIGLGLNIPSTSILVTFGDLKRIRTEFSATPFLYSRIEVHGKSILDAATQRTFEGPGQTMLVLPDADNSYSSVRFRKELGTVLSISIDLGTLLMSRYYISGGRKYTARDCVSVVLYILSKMYRTIEYYAERLNFLTMLWQQTALQQEEQKSVDVEAYLDHLTYLNQTCIDVMYPEDGDDTISRMNVDRAVGAVLPANYLALTKVRTLILQYREIAHGLFRPMRTAGVGLEYTLYHDIHAHALEDVLSASYDVEPLLPSLSEMDSLCPYDTVTTGPTIDPNVVGGYIAFARVIRELLSPIPLEWVCPIESPLIKVDQDLQDYRYNSTIFPENHANACCGLQIDIQAYAAKMMLKNTSDFRKVYDPYIISIVDGTEVDLTEACVNPLDVFKQLIIFDPMYHQLNSHTPTTVDLPVVAEERIMFQKKSVLGDALLEVAKDLYAEKDKYIKEHPMAYATPGDIMAMTKYMDMYAAKIFVPGLRKAFEKAKIGITLSTVELYSSNALSGVFCMYTWMPDAGKENINQLRNIFPNQKGAPRQTVSSASKALFTALSVAFDPGSSRLLKTEEYVEMALALGLGDMLFTDLYYPESEDIHMTPEELVASILHETGHAMSTVEYSRHSYSAIKTIYDTLPFILENGTPKEKTEVITKIKEEAAKSIALQNTVLSGRPADVMITTLITALLTMGFPTFMIGFLVIAVVIIAVKTLYNLVTPVSNSIAANVGPAGGKEKKSDLATTGNLFRLCEQYADEFTAMHGYGAAFVTSLVKNRKLGRLMYGNGATLQTKYELTHRSVVSTLFGRMLYSLGLLMMGNQSATGILLYGSDQTRFRDILRANYQVLKDTNLPKKTQEYLIDEIRLIQEQIKDVESGASKKVAMAFWAVIDAFTSGTGYTNMATRLGTGNLEEGYRILQDATNGLIRNPLYYQSVRVKLLGEDKDEV